MRNYEPITVCKYGKLAEKVNLEPDFFTGFEPQRRKEIVTEEAKFYHSITEPYSVDDALDKFYTSIEARDGFSVPVKVYRPKKEGAKRPAVLFFHGGGFMTCSVETHDFVPSYLAAKADAVAFSVEYRLAPEHKFPVGLNDCYDAVKQIAARADEFGIDPGKLIVGGDSSGGNFAAAIALEARGKDDFSLFRQILIYPALDFTGRIPKKSAEVYTMVGSDGDDGPSPMLTSYLTDVEREVEDPLVSPIVADDLSNLPEALFIEAECDALLDDGLIYAKLLRDAGVPVEYHVYEGMPHAFILRTYEETFEALNAICAFIRK